MSAFLLKTFAEELTPAWHQLFQLSVDTHTVPELWKRSIIIPVPKKSFPQENNDYRPETLTSNVMKSLERIIIEELRTEVEPSLDQYQFAYRRNRSTNDAISTILHLVLKHLESPVAYARLFFIAFNSIFRHNPLKKFVHSFLSNMPQQVKFNSALSDIAVCSTGSPKDVSAHPSCLLDIQMIVLVPNRTNLL